jgi:hypothetical protein
MKALLDSDLYAFRASAACENEDVEQACRSVDSLIINTLMCGVDKCGYVDRWQLYLTGKDNFRYNIAVTAPYKGNRVDKVKPKHLAAVRQHLVDHWGAVVYDGIEADDAIATDATTLGDEGVIVSLDKDLDQVAGWHYNFIKKTAYCITPEKAVHNLYMQILTGDNADNIIGLKGIGPVKAEKILEGAVDECEMYQRCVEAYDGVEERVIENAHLLFLRRHEGQIWKPPTVTN